MKNIFDINTYVKKIKKGDGYFETFINKQSLAAGVLVLESGEPDTQEPHDSDEVYFIISGDGHLRIRGKDHDVFAGGMFFVARNTPHYFHGNKKELRALYFFGGSNP